MASDFALSTPVGTFAAVDFGGQGTDVLLLHNSGGNVEALRPLAERLSDRCHPIVVDLRGHGQTLLPLEEQSQSWTDLGPISDVFQHVDPVVIAEGTMAWMAVSAVLQGIISVRALVLLGAHPFVRPGAASRALLEQLTTDDVLDMLQQRMHLGERVRVGDRDTFLDEAERVREGDWFLGGIPPELWRAWLTRALVPTEEEGILVCQPLPETLRLQVDLGPQLDPFPGAEAFEGITAPLLFVDPRDGVTADDVAAVEAVVAAAENRRSVLVGGVGHLGIAHSRKVADEIVALMADLVDDPVPGGGE